VELGLSKKADYVVRAAISLGRAGEGDFRKVREISAEMDLPPKFAPQILNMLVKAGLVESRAGQHGGYRLTRDPAAISLFEIIEAAEGSLWPNKCTLRGGPCHWDNMCAIHPSWENAHRALSEALRRETLGGILRTDRRLEAGERLAPRKPHDTTAVSTTS
jgi:Rrf2 family protein